MILVVHFKIPNQNSGFVLQFDGFQKWLGVAKIFFLSWYTFAKSLLQNRDRHTKILNIVLLVHLYAAYNLYWKENI